MTKAKKAFSYLEVFLIAVVFPLAVVLLIAGFTLVATAQSINETLLGVAGLFFGGGALTALYQKLFLR